ncbi:MAG: PQQ-binding-like beta-propeller repeat protein, partial [Anaerolineae bacterium]|nr:PQQ-binding-like beta-propeller repeat protein [Anaerolineae bacterium]
LPTNGRALAMAGNVIFVAGVQMSFKDPTWQKYEAAYNGRLGGRLLALSAADGKEIATYKLQAAPVWDSVAVARGQLYISLTDGTIQCMGE